MFVSKSKYNKLLEDSLKIESDRNRLDALCTDQDNQIRELKKEVERLNNLTIVDNSTGGSVTLKVSKDLESVQPVVKYNPDIFEKLVELQYLDDTHQNNKFAIQLALMQVSFEALTQIIEAFEADVGE